MEDEIMKGKVESEKWMLVPTLRKDYQGGHNSGKNDRSGPSCREKSIFPNVGKYE